MNRLARELTTSYNPAPLAYTSPTSSEASEDSASTSPSEEAELVLEDCCAPHEMAFAAGLPEIMVYPQTLRAALSNSLILMATGILMDINCSCHVLFETCVCCY
jgi:hypothetical protein